MQQLKTKDDERCAALQAQAASMAHNLEVKAALEAQLAMMAEDNRAKAEALKDLEASNDRQAAAAAEMGRKLQEAEGHETPEVQTFRAPTNSQLCHQLSLPYCWLRSPQAWILPVRSHSMSHSKALRNHMSRKAHRQCPAFSPQTLQVEFLPG